MNTQVKKTGPSVNRHRSEQDVSTPWEFIAAVEKRFGKLSVDLAASNENSKAPMLITKKDDSFQFLWYKLRGLLWLNPPFGDIAPWAEKCCDEADSGATILMLVPCSADSNWWASYVHHIAWVLFVNPRIKFVGSTHGYPKPLALCCYGLPQPERYAPWRWKA